MKQPYNKIWVTKVLESRFPFGIQNPMVASITKICLVPNLYFIIFCLIRYEHMSTGFLIGYILAMICLNLASFLIWYSDQKLLPNFFSNISDIVRDQERVNVLSTKYGTLFRKRCWILAIPWTLILICVWAASLDLLSLEGGILGLGDIFYWIWFVIIVMTGILHGIGLWGVLVTVLAIREVSKENLYIDPLHPDKMGGLSAIGSFAIGTTLLFSAGSLYLPLGFQLASGNELVTSFVYLATLIYSIFILMSFLGPTIMVHKEAKLIRDTILVELRKQYTEQINKLSTNNKNHTDIAISYLKLSHIRSEYLEYQNVRLYPFEFGIFVKLITSVVIPLIFLLIRQGYISLDFLGF